MRTATPTIYDSIPSVREYPFVVGGKPSRSGRSHDVINPPADAARNIGVRAAGRADGSPISRDALALVKALVLGLQAGVFTASLEHALLAFDRLEVGGVIVGDVPTWRLVHMSYGDVKDSGLGREGPRYTIEEMTEPRLLVINRQLS